MAIAAAVAAAVIALLAGLRRLLNRSRAVAEATIVDPQGHTTMSPDGAVRSVQAVELTLPMKMLQELWTPMYLERLARTYWRYLTRCTLGLIRVVYDEDERRVVLLVRRLTLLRFRAPEYELAAERAIVRWRIEDGLLVSSTGHHGDGYLEIDVRRCPPVDATTGRVHIEVEVANFYPWLASAIAHWFYAATQSRLHVVVTHGFLRSLARLDLAESVVGRYAQPASGADGSGAPPPGEAAPPERAAAARAGDR